MSVIGWVDFSPEHRRRVNVVLDLLKTKGMLDELGVGPIRNAFSERLFPGLSTIQTRAKYFVLIPYLLRQFEQLTGVRPKASDWLRDKENKLVNRLVRNNPGELGVMGNRLAAGKTLQRRPSEIYWAGLREFGIVRTMDSREEFLRKLERRSIETSLAFEGTESHRGDDRDALLLVPSPIEVPDGIVETSIHLTRQEAEFLYERMTTRLRPGQPASLLSHLLRSASSRKIVAKAKPFSLELCLEEDGLVTDNELRRLIQMAVDFSNIMRGAHIIYNQLVQRECNGMDGCYADEWEEWWDFTRNNRQLWNRWNTEALWQLARHAKPKFSPFISRWVQDVKKGVDKKSLEYQVRIQELRNKGKARARLRQQNRDRTPDKWIGINHINYRTQTARQIIADIQRGLES